MSDAAARGRKLAALSDPWRVCCPDCGSTQVRRRTEAGGRGVDRRAGPANGSYWWCRNCQTVLTELYDKKVGHCVEVR